MDEDKEPQEAKVLKVFVWEDISANDKAGKDSKEGTDGTEKKDQ